MASASDEQDPILSTVSVDPYTRGLAHGLLVAVTLLRAGCEAEDLGLLLDNDPGRTDWMVWYWNHVEQLRRILQETPCTETQA